VQSGRGAIARDIVIVTEELMYRRTGTAVAVYETFRLAACRTWDRRLQKYLGRSIFRRFLGQ
ncbi:hypothetical protein, partial [Massilia sp. CCM 8734]|uniref:hypothetical protein n=1 Tax=Massilia sp. CCM 8734 TaxID=2609283 RepID=UPI001AAFD1C6